MIINDCVLDLKRYWAPYGSVAPAATPWPDVSRYHTDGVVTTATWVQHPSGLWYKDFNSATPDYVEVTCPQLNFTSEDYSFVIRFNANSIATDPVLFNRGFWATDGYYIRFTNTGYVSLYTFPVAAEDHSSTSVGSIVIDTWYTLGISKFGTAVNLYINGVDDTDVVGVHLAPTTCARTAKVGIADDLTSVPFDGQISAIKVFSYALNPDQQMQQHILLSNNWE